ncbi:PREDICTED: uncharacterized protein LOC104809412 isoform X2 [Tarenaya hassleriana]|uniref:uncharacterized protein LOC104809412 isoform X2 n=1 Tax=Tarenaya hassleriana TaxID=28532 RepID=UPI00053C510A|nr:PREDICTED: uncharacterized protein LOC104809412 isoform X2 [Tarenaya hassleriana]
MLRQLPPTITADKSPDWLPAGWIAQSTVLKSGREVRSYTHLNTCQRFSSKDDVLQYIEMEKIREIRYSETEREKNCGMTIQNPGWLPDHWVMEERKGSSGNVYKVYTNLSTGYKCYTKRAVQRCLGYAEQESGEQKEIYIDMVSGCKCHSKADVIRFLDSLKLEASTKELEDRGTNEDIYGHRGELPAYPKMKLRTRKRGLTKGKQIEPPSPPARRQKLRSCGTRRQLFVDDDTNCFGEDALPEAEALTDANHNETDSLEAELFVSPLAVGHAEEDLHDVVVQFDDLTKESLGMTVSSLSEINVGCQGGLPEKDLNECRIEEIGATSIEMPSTDPKVGKDGLLMSGSESAEDETYQESGCKSKEPLKEQALQGVKPCPEEITKVSSRLLFFPFRDASTDADHAPALDTSTATLSADDLGKTIELTKASCPDNPGRKNIRISRMQNKSIRTSLPKKKDKDHQIPFGSTEQHEKAETPSKLRGERSKKASMSASVEQRLGLYGSWQETHDFACKNSPRIGMSAIAGSSRNSRRSARQLMGHWPDLCPEFVFETLTSATRKEDDSVVRIYLEEQHVTAAGNTDGNLPLPDFGLPSFAHQPDWHN